MKTKVSIVIAAVAVLFWFAVVRHSHRVPQPLLSKAIVNNGAAIPARRIPPEESSKKILNSSPEMMSSLQAPPQNRTFQDVFSGPLMNPEKVAELAQSLAPGEQKDQVLDQLAWGWAAKNPDAARAWASQRSNAEERDRLLEIINTVREKRDSADVPESQIVADLTEALIHSGADESKQLQVENLTQKWATKNLSAALDWVKQQPASEIRDNLIQRIAVIEAAKAPAEAARLVVEQIAPGPAQTEAVISVVHQWGIQDMIGAVAWVNLFRDGQLKERAVRELEGIAQISFSN